MDDDTDITPLKQPPTAAPSRPASPNSRPAGRNPAVSEPEGPPIEEECTTDDEQKAFLLKMVRSTTEP